MIGTTQSGRGVATEGHADGGGAGVDSEPKCRVSTGAEVAAVLACLTLGLLVATLPHLISGLRLGDPTWVADHDDLFYLSLGSTAYHNHPTFLSDPVRESGGPSIYRALPLLPGVLIAKWLRLGPLGIGLAWRAWGALLTALTLFLLFRHHVRRPWPAAALAMIALADCGLDEARPLVRTASIATRVATGRAGTLFDGKPMIHGEWRVATPALTQAYLFLSLWLLARACERPTRRRLILSGIGFGILFYVYFYYWTAVGLGLLMGLVVDAGRRRVYLHTGWIGGLVGLPAVAADMIMKKSTPPDWLLRTDKFVPIDRFHELLIPRGALLLLVAALVWACWRRRNLLGLGLITAAGLVLANHQVITGLQIENFHWNYVWGPCLSLLVLLILARVLESPRLGLAARRALVAACVVLVPTGLWLRGAEATRTRESRELLEGSRRYKAQRFTRSAPALVPRSLVAGESEFVDFAVIMENVRPLDGYMVILSPSVTDPDLMTRHALNRFLSGFDRATFERQARAEIQGSHWGPWILSRDPSANARRLADQMVAYDAVARDPAAWCDRYQVRYLGLPAGQSPPPGLGWDLLEGGPAWQIWWRRPGLASAQAPRHGPRRSDQDLDRHHSAPASPVRDERSAPPPT